MVVAQQRIELCLLNWEAVDPDLLCIATLRADRCLGALPYLPGWRGAGTSTVPTKISGFRHGWSPLTHIASYGRPVAAYFGPSSRNKP